MKYSGPIQVFVYFEVSVELLVEMEEMYWDWKQI
jgi:hypothetical protein